MTSHSSGGAPAIARYLYVHSPALKLAAEPGDEQSDVRFTYEITTLELPAAAQIYEVSMGNAVRIVRLLSGTASGPSAVSFMHDQQGSGASYATELGCDVRCAPEIEDDLRSDWDDGRRSYVNRVGACNPCGRQRR